MSSTLRNSAAPAHDESVGLAVGGFDAIYDRMVDYVWNVVRRMGVPQSDAEDVVQEVFVTVYRRLSEFEGRAQLKTWVFAIAVHFVQHYFRTHVRKPGDRAAPTGTEIHALADQRENGPASEVERLERYDALDRVLAQLDEAKRLVFVLADRRTGSGSIRTRRFEPGCGTMRRRIRGGVTGGPTTTLAARASRSTTRRSNGCGATKDCGWPQRRRRKRVGSSTVPDTVTADAPNRVRRSTSSSTPPPTPPPDWCPT